MGDVWTWTAICADTKLIPTWFVGERNLYFASLFLEDLASRLANRIQLTSDGLKVYFQAVEHAWPSRRMRQYVTSPLRARCSIVSRYGS